MVGMVKISVRVPAELAEGLDAWAAALGGPARRSFEG
jgi:hypothetical protein